MVVSAETKAGEVSICHQFDSVLLYMDKGVAHVTYFIFFIKCSIHKRMPFTTHTHLQPIYTSRTHISRLDYVYIQVRKTEF